MSDNDAPDRRRYVTDRRLRNMLSYCGIEVTLASSWDRLNENMEWVRYRFGRRKEIETREDFVDKLMDVETARTKRHTRWIIWSLGLVGTIVAAIASGFVPLIFNYLVPPK